MTTLTDVAELLNGLYAMLTGSQPAADTEHTTLVLQTVYATLSPTEKSAYPDTLRAFAILHHDDLSSLVRGYGPGSALGRMDQYVLVGTPAVIALCERLTVKPMHLQAVWANEWESDTDLEDLRAAWAV